MFNLIKYMYMIKYSTKIHTTYNINTKYLNEMHYENVFEPFLLIYTMKVSENHCFSEVF